MKCFQKRALYGMKELAVEESSDIYNATRSYTFPFASLINVQTTQAGV